MQQGLIESLSESVNVDPGLAARADKRRVAANFSKAAATYDLAATLQERVAAQAMLGLPASCHPGRVLDMGSGTGLQTAQLAEHYPGASVTGMDLAQGMLSFARQQYSGVKWCSGDIEALPFLDESFDIVFSSMAIQWCSLQKVLEEACRVLQPGGWFIFSTLAAGTMQELRQAWAAVDGYSHVNGFESYRVQKNTLQQSAFRVHSFRQQTEIVYYPSVIQLLRDLKALGVNTVPSRQQGLVSKGRITQMQKAYGQFRTEAGLPLSYQVLYGTLYKPLNQGA